MKTKLHVKINMFKLKKKEARRTDIPCFSRGNIWEGKEVFFSGKLSEVLQFLGPFKTPAVMLPIRHISLQPPIGTEEWQGQSSGFIPIFWKAKHSKITYTTRTRLLVS